MAYVAPRSPRAAELLRFLTIEQAARGGVSPSFDECAQHLGVSSKATISRLVNWLERYGYIRRLSYRWRSIEVLRPAPVSVAPDGAPLTFVPLPAGVHRGSGPVSSCGARPGSFDRFHEAHLSHD